MFGVEDLLHPARFKVRMVAKHVHQCPARDPKQRRCAVHVNGANVLGPRGKGVHWNHPFTTGQT
jgi:hypothetical protein